MDHHLIQLCVLDSFSLSYHCIPFMFFLFSRSTIPLLALPLLAIHFHRPSRQLKPAPSFLYCTTNRVIRQPPMANYQIPGPKASHLLCRRPPPARALSKTYCLTVTENQPCVSFNNFSTRHGSSSPTIDFGFSVPWGHLPQPQLAATRRQDPMCHPSPMGTRSQQPP